MRNNVTGIVLAGGASRRMGKNKGLLELHGRPLLALTVDRSDLARPAPKCTPVWPSVNRRISSTSSRSLSAFLSSASNSPSPSPCRSSIVVRVLHITDGDSAAQGIATTGISGPIIAWRDVLHDGPVPGGLTPDELRAQRARFLAACGWASYDQALADFRQRDEALAGFRSHDETVLWFELDLHDQLQLLQVLTRFSGQDVAGVTLTLISAEEYRGPALRGLQRELALMANRMLAERLARAAIGKARMEPLIAMP